MTDHGIVVPVEIRGHRYPIRTELDPAYVTRLAAYVDEKMRVAAESMPAGDSTRLAVIAALNIADELFRYRELNDARDGRLAVRAEELERLVDSVLVTRTLNLEPDQP